MRRLSTALLAAFVLLALATLFHSADRRVQVPVTKAQPAAPPLSTSHSHVVSYQTADASAESVVTLDATSTGSADARHSTPQSKPLAHDPRTNIASAWDSDTRPEHAAFRVWTARYLHADTDVAKHALLAEGVELAETRRAALQKLIVSDPEAALASAVPMAIRTVLPASIISRLEKRISARGELALLAVTPAPGAEAPAESSYRAALIEGTEYRAFVYGHRASQTTITDAALSGIAVDRSLAVSDSPVRVLEPAELPPPSAPTLTTCPSCAAALIAPPSGSVVYEYAGGFGEAPTLGHFQADADALERAEHDLTEADNQPGSSGVVGRPALAWTHSLKKILIIRVAFTDLPGVPVSFGDPVTDEYAVQRITEAGGVGDFYLASSFGKTALTISPAVAGDSPDVTPVFTLSRTALSYAIEGASAALHADARAAASAAGFDLSAYDRVGVVFSSLADLKLVDETTGKIIKTSQIKYGGLATIIGPNFWVNGAYTFRVVAHELGHTFGLRHANLWKVTDGNPASEAGETTEYGDPFDLMGGGTDFSAMEDFGPWNKSILQWIPDSSVNVIEASGTYRVHRIDAAGADLTLSRALKIVRDPTRDYWIGYRRATDNASLNGGAYVVWGYNSNKQSDLLDLSTPGTNPNDAALSIGTTFDDTAGGITLKPVAQGGSGADEWLDVEIGIRPRVRWVSSEVLAAEQSGLVSLTLRRSGSPAGEISINYSTEPGTATATSDYADTSGSVTWADGDTADKTITIPLVADGVAEGSETFNVRLNSITGGVRVGPAEAKVIIAEAGAADGTFGADFINSTVNRLLALPDGSVIAGGSFTQVQDAAAAIFNVGRIARFTSTGSNDLGSEKRGNDVEFSAGAGANDQIRALALQADGRILVGGDFTSFGGVAAGRIVRLFPDGSVDPSFKPGAGADNDVHDIVVQPDGRILIVGAFTKFGATARNRLVRVNPDGSIDKTFANPSFAATTLRSVALQPDGKVLVAGGLSYSGLSGVGFKSGVARLTAAGARDATFDVGYGAHTVDKTSTLTSVFRIILQPDGRIVVVGAFTGFGGLTGKPRQYVARLSATGAVDLNFTPGLGFDDSAQPTSRVITGLKALPGNRVLIGGNFNAVGSVACEHLALLNEDGTAGAAFAAAGGHVGRVLDFALLPDGKALLAGDPTKFQNSTQQRPIWRFVPGLAGAPGAIQFSADAYTGREGGTAVLTVSRVGGSFGAAKVAYDIAKVKSGDTATAGADYVPTSGILEWASGDTSEKTITIPIAQDSAVDEGETFTVRLGEPVLGGVSLGTRREAVVMIAPFDVRAQAIAFPALPDFTLGNLPITLIASSTSGRTVGFELVSGFATLNGSVLTPTAAGFVTVRAVQNGDDDFDPATAVERTFAVYTPATITLENLTQTYAAAPRTASFSSTPSGIAATFTYTGSSTPPINAGSYPVQLTVVEPFVSGSASGNLVIAKAPLVVRPNDQRRIVGTSNAAILIAYSGFQGAENENAPGVLTKRPVAKTTAIKTSKPGNYPITLSGGAAQNYEFSFVPGSIQVIGFGGAYETLLTPVGGGNPLGKLALNVSATSPVFTGALDLGEEPAFLPIGGALTLDAPPAEGEPDTASGAWASTAAAPRNFRVQFSVSANGCIARIYRGDTLIAEGTGPRIFVPAAKSAVSWAAQYTAWLDQLAPLNEADIRAIPPGFGHAVFTVPATGAFNLALNLPDGSKLTVPLKPDAAGLYRLFGRPHGKRANSFIAGLLDVGAGSAQNLVWQKAAATGTTVDANLRSGFALDLGATVRKWTAPTTTAPVLTLDDVLGLSPTTKEFGISYDAGESNAANLSTVPTTLLLTSANKVTLSPATSPNPRKFSLTVMPKTGAFSGSFVLPDARKVTFSGALRPAPENAAEAVDIGLGYFVIPPAAKGGESTPGELRLIAPAPVAAP